MGKIKIFDCNLDFVESLNKAHSILSSGGVAGLPTETVYGLAGAVDCPQALESIFSLKNRPLSDPLIVHIFDASWLERYGDLTSKQKQVCLSLANRFWPGPLTLVVEAKNHVHALVRAGAETLGMRSPHHPFFRAVLDKLQTGIAAPSANVFGHISPTSAADVAKEFSKHDLCIFDGGECSVGIESTVVRVYSDGQTRILRPGKVTLEQIEECINVHFDHEIQLATLGSKNADSKVENQSPGQGIKHYAPVLPTYILEAHTDINKHFLLTPQGIVDLRKSVVIDFGSKLINAFQCLKYLNPSPDGNLEDFARTLFKTLRFAEEVPDAQNILIHFDTTHLLKTSCNESDFSEAIHDRIRRAASGQTAKFIEN